MNLIFYGFLVMLLGIEVNGLSLAPLSQSAVMPWSCKGYKRSIRTIHTLNGQFH